MSVSVPRRNRVLVVEDKPSLASVYRTHLEGHGFCCDLVSSPRAAAAKIETGGIDAVILSLELDGPDCTSLIESWSAGNPRASVIVIAANASINGAVDAVRAGAWDYLVKPVSRNRLITTLSNACNSPVRPVEEARPATPAPNGKAVAPRRSAPSNVPQLPQ